MITPIENLFCVLKDTQEMGEGWKSIARNDVSEHLIIQKFSGASPLDPKGGLQRPQTQL